MGPAKDGQSRGSGRRWIAPPVPSLAIAGIARPEDFFAGLRAPGAGTSSDAKGSATTIDTSRARRGPGGAETRARPAPSGPDHRGRIAPAPVPAVDPGDRSPLGCPSTRMRAGPTARVPPVACRRARRRQDYSASTLLTRSGSLRLSGIASSTSRSSAWWPACASSIWAVMGWGRSWPDAVLPVRPRPSAPGRCATSRRLSARSRVERRAIVRGMFRTSGGFSFSFLKFSTLTPDGHARARDIRGRGARAPRLCPRPGRRSLHRALRLLGAAARSFMRWRSADVGRARGRSTTGSSIDLLESMRMRTGNSVIYRRGTIRRVLRALAVGARRGVLINQHIHTAMPSTSISSTDPPPRPPSSPRLPSALARRWCRFALPLARGRYRMVYELPVDPPLGREYRTPSMSSRSAAPTCSRCTVRRRPELWLWMHRRWRDLDEGRQDRRHVPGGVERGRECLA